jgi:hypothetical protein
MDENSEALRLLSRDEERPKRLRENDFGGDTNDQIAIAEGFTKRLLRLQLLPTGCFTIPALELICCWMSDAFVHILVVGLFRCFRRLRKVLTVVRIVTENTHIVGFYYSTYRTDAMQQHADTRQESRTFYDREATAEKLYGRCRDGVVTMNLNGFVPVFWFDPTGLNCF